MRKTNISEHSNYITVTTDILAKKLCCGKETARKIGKKSDAELKVGRRTLWIISKIEAYLNKEGRDSYEEMER